MTEEAVPPNDQDNGLLLDASTVVKLLLDGTDDRAFGHAVLELTFLEVANTLYRIDFSGGGILSDTNCRSELLIVAVAYKRTKYSK